VSSFNDDALQLIDISNPAALDATLYLKNSAMLDGATSTKVV
jgi:hypothetical protein